MALLDDDSFETAVPETILLRLQVTVAGLQGITVAEGAFLARIEVVDDDAEPTTLPPTTMTMPPTTTPMPPSTTTMPPTTTPTPPQQPENNATCM